MPASCIYTGGRYMALAKMRVPGGVTAVGEMYVSLVGAGGGLSQEILVGTVDGAETSDWVTVSHTFTGVAGGDADGDSACQVYVMFVIKSKGVELDVDDV